MSARFISFACWLLAAPGLAANAERGEPEARREILPKLELLCGTPFSVSCDLPSLRELNRDIRYDQASGSLECDEPLRLPWRLWQSEQGRVVVRRHGLREVRCRGVAGSVGRLSVSKGTVPVDERREGLVEEYDGGARVSQSSWKDGTQAWSKEFSKDGELVRYTRQLDTGMAAYSRYSARVAVNGKKDGEERVSREDGTLERSTRWRAGVQHGVEQHFAREGNKVIRRGWDEQGTLLRDEAFEEDGSRKVDGR